MPTSPITRAMATLSLFAATVTTTPAQTANTYIDFGTPLPQALAPAPFSSSISTYGQNGGSIIASATQRANLASLGLGLYRVPLQWNGGNIISGAAYGPTNISGDQWVSGIKSLGAQPMVVVAGSSNNNFTPDDAAALVQHFNPGNPVGYWVIGNEPDNDHMSMAAYCALFNATVDKMKAVDPTIKVAGPAWSHYDQNELQAFLDCAGSKVDVIDYHHYAMGGSYLDNATALAQTPNWESEISQLRQMVNTTVPQRAAAIEIQVGEYNWSWRTGDGYPGRNGDDRFYQGVATVWSASVAGHIMRAGGRGHQYSDQNGALGLTFEKQSDATYYGQRIDAPMPIYHGLRMFSGGDLFRPFGSVAVSASTTLANVEVFASTNGQNVVMINKDPAATQIAILQASGTSATTVDVWQTDNNAPFQTPQFMASLVLSNGLSYALPPYSVTTFVFR
ncbi:GH39 family glycosyl hydrolase [Dyella choica]|uniref:Glycosyl hydrolases family 39 N-terminal catalytic domain-containing protein n=1 Tax=Dyella choica TaxID=1927959 RepID=A0A3S0Q2Q5_9GAMM|nr:hypothetical protein [Dyella choica]RUL71414.1 hypothetical protein EKH80_18670 [Dyella choica]